MFYEFFTPLFSSDKIKLDVPFRESIKFYNGIFIDAIIK